MEVPTYIINAIYRHYKYLVENVKVDISDNKALNMRRMAKEDIRRLERIIDRNNDRERQAAY